MTVTKLLQSHRLYPRRLTERLGSSSPPRLEFLGDLEILRLGVTALFCSARSPGEAILAAHDQAARWRDSGTCIISGFHSTIEMDCLKILLRGRQPIIICPARGLGGMRVPTIWRAPLAKGRILVLSAFADHEQRVTKSLAVRRNQFVAALADEIVFAHVTAGGQLDGLSEFVSTWGIPQRRLVN